MKIVHYIFSFNVGGAELMLIDLANEQSKNFNVSIIILNKDFNVDLLSKLNCNIQVVFLNRAPKSFSLIPFLKLNFILLKNYPDVIHCHSYNCCLTLLKVFNTVLTVHTTGIPVKFLFLYNRIFSISDGVANDLMKRSSKLKIFTIPNGINFSLIRQKEKFQKGFPFKIVQIGRLEHLIKGQDILIKSISFLLQNFNINNISVDFIGIGDSYEYLKSLTISYGLESNIHFLGLQSRNEIFSALKDYDLLVQPSNVEGFGLSIVEALFAKVPVLVSDIDGPLEIIDNGIYGFYFKKGDYIDLSKKILYIFENYDNLIKIVDLALYSAVKRFSVSNMSKNYCNFYKKQIN